VTFVVKLQLQEFGPDGINFSSPPTKRLLVNAQRAKACAKTICMCQDARFEIEI
jgi:hypothetical protein